MGIRKLKRVEFHSPGIITFWFCMCAMTLWSQSVEEIWVYPGNQVHLDAAVTGVSGYQWYWNNTPVEGATAAQFTAAEEGVYTVSVVNQWGCLSEPSNGIWVRFYESQEIPVYGQTEVCYQTVHLYAVTGSYSDFTWMVEGGQIIAGGQHDATVTVYWNQTGPGSVSVVAQGDNQELLFGSAEVEVINCTDLSVSKTVSQEAAMEGEEIQFVVTVQNEGPSAAEQIEVYEAIPSGYVYLNSQATHGAYHSLSGLWSIPLLNPSEAALLSINVKVLPSGNYLNTAFLQSSQPQDINPDNDYAEAGIEKLCLTVYNEFSPNNDGANDFFKIECIERYSNKLEIYDRTGRKVFSAVNYQNDWEGTNRKGEILPSGTYYYVLVINEDRILKGWVSFIR